MVYTGIVQTVGNARFDPESHHLFVRGPPDFWQNSKSGDSVGVNGVCLTLLGDPKGEDGEFFVMEETRSKTTFDFVMKDPERHNKEFLVNVEHSMRMGDSVGGHKVMGHVDGMGKITDIQFAQDGSCNMWIDISNCLSAFSTPPIVHKGSICLDGTSLTVAELKNDNTLVRVSLIPYTLKHTTLHTRKVGDFLNVEFDHDLLVDKAAVSEWEQSYKPDEFFMEKAIAQGDKGRLTAPPNPWVGSVVVAKDGKTILGEGFHRKAGEPHAEVNAINDAKARGNADKIAGCTVYVTLEPCHHFGRTPPCDKLLVDSGVGRVVIGVLDPDTRVSGEGVKFLREHNIEVAHGICEDKVRESLGPYLHQRATKRPYVVVKSALSLDAKVACQDGTSQWITGEAARAHGHMLRAKSQAILVGSRTALVDKPMLTVRGIPNLANKPLRVVVDSKGVVLEGPLLDVSHAPTLIFYTSKAPATSVEAWTKAGVESVCVNEDKNGRVDLAQVLDELGKRGIIQLLIEGGGEIHSEFLKNNFVDELGLFYGACILGNSAKSWISTDIFSTISDVRFWTLVGVQQFGNDVYALYRKKN